MDFGVKYYILRETKRRSAHLRDIQRKEIQRSMGKRQNQNFLEKYIKLDKACADVFGLKNGGVSEYINKLGTDSEIPDRKETMTRLVKYRSLRNKLAHEVGALEKMTEIKGDDIKWVVSFEKDVIRGKDPLARHKKNLYKKTKEYKMRRALIISVIVRVVLLAAAATLYFGVFAK